MCHNSSLCHPKPLWLAFFCTIQNRLTLWLCVYGPKKKKKEVKDISQILFIYVPMNWGWVIGKIFILGQTITLIWLKQYGYIGWINKSSFKDLILSSLRLLLHISTFCSTRIVKLSLMRSKMIPWSKIVCMARIALNSAMVVDWPCVFYHTDEVLEGYVLSGCALAMHRIE